MNAKLLPFFLIFLLTGCLSGDSPSGTVQIETDFSSGFGPWVPLDSGVWEIEERDGKAYAVLAKPGTQRPPVRRPTAYLLLPDHRWQDMEITLQARTLEPARTINRDIVVIFGYVDETHFYYAHISSNADDRFHNILMKVDGTERQTIHKENLPEARLSDEEHTIRVRHSRSGEIAVFVDDMKEPLMTAKDPSYPVGLVGFGAFDDRAEFSHVLVKGELVTSGNQP